MKSIKTSLNLFLITLSLALLPFHLQGKANENKVDFSNVVYIGDSLTAGFQSGALIESGQLNGYANRIAEQAGFDITFPLVSAPGIPPELILLSIDPLVIEPVCIIGVDPNCPGMRINPFNQATNLAVPGHTVEDALTSRAPDPVNPLTDVVLGLPGLLLMPPVIKSQVEWAEALSPTFVFVWLGANDVLGFATTGGTGTITPTIDFESQYREVIDRVATTGADSIVANIPDVTVLPFFTSAQDIADAVGAPLAIIGPDLGIQDGDFVTLPGISAIPIFLDGNPATVLPDALVLDAGETQQAQVAVREFNDIIEQVAAENNIPVVNAFGAFNRIDTFGKVIQGTRLTTDFLGGIFSLDGVHPSNTGYALAANEFIHTLNKNYATGIKNVNIKEVAAEDPLVIPGVVRKPPKSLVQGGINDEAINGMLRMLFHH